MSSRIKVTVGPDDNAMTFLYLLTLVFITLKLTGYIAWSWWWVLAPLWGAFAVGIVLLAVVVLVHALRGDK